MHTAPLTHITYDVHFSGSAIHVHGTGIADKTGLLGISFKVVPGPKTASAPITGTVVLRIAVSGTPSDVTRTFKVYPPLNLIIRVHGTTVNNSTSLVIQVGLATRATVTATAVLFGAHRPVATAQGTAGSRQLLALKLPLGILHGRIVTVVTIQHRHDQRRARDAIDGGGGPSLAACLGAFMEDRGVGRQNAALAKQRRELRKADPDAARRSWRHSPCPADTWPDAKVRVLTFVSSSATSATRLPTRASPAVLGVDLFGPGSKLMQMRHVDGACSEQPEATNHIQGQRRAFGHVGPRKHLVQQDQAVRTRLAKNRRHRAASLSSRPIPGCARSSVGKWV